MPNRNTGGNRVVYGRTFVNSNASNVTESTNWRADWLRSCGTSYADVVKHQGTCNNTTYYDKKFGNESVSHTTRVRVRTILHGKSDENSNPLNSMTKTSDVSKPLCKRVNVNNLGLECESPISIENRFNMLPYIDSNDIDQSHVLQKNSDEPMEQSMWHKSGTLISKHAGKAVTKSLGDLNENQQTRYSKNFGFTSQVKNYNKIGKRKHGSKIKLIETDGKYDLELRFRPRHR